MTAIIKFGPAGNGNSFYDNGHKSSLEMPAFLKSAGLNAYEYQCGHGVRISPDGARELGAKAAENGISLSIHAPYYISLSSTEPEKQDNNLRYVLQTLTAANYMGASRIVIHMGSAKGITRKAAMDISRRAVMRMLNEADEAGLGHIHICPETMGKINQMGTLDEVLELCKLDQRLIPALDFGHMNARSQGALSSVEAFSDILDKIEQTLGEYRAKHFHSHFSKIEYTNAGEKRHLTFDDNIWGPDFSHLSQALVQHGAEPVIICESAGTQTEDAVYMQQIYQNFKSKGMN